MHGKQTRKQEVGNKSITKKHNAEEHNKILLCEQFKYIEAVSLKQETGVGSNQVRSRDRGNVWLGTGCGFGFGFGFSWLSGEL